MNERLPVWTTRLTTPGADAFAILSGMEAFSRALVVAPLSIQTQELIGSDEGVSAMVLAGSVAALSVALLIPRLAVAFGRARLCAAGIALALAATGFFTIGVVSAQLAGFIARAVGSAVFFATLSMYIMDHVRRDRIGRSEPLRLLYIGLGWTVGPVAGVELGLAFGPWVPFVAAAAVIAAQLVYFLFLRFSNNPAVRAAPRRRPVVARHHVREYFSQPRLITAWAHAVGRGFVWNAFNTYTPLFAVATGLGAGAGGLMVGIGSSFMLAMPLWGWLARRFGIRRVSLVCFPLGAAAAVAAGSLSATPWLAAGLILVMTLSMSIVDGYGNALFLRACKPSQRTTLTPIFSTQRDFAEIGQAAVFTVLLSLLPIETVYVALGLVLAGLTVLTLRIHPRL
jgi:MFS family permease